MNIWVISQERPARNHGRHTEPVAIVKREVAAQTPLPVLNGWLDRQGIPPQERGGYTIRLMEVEELAP